MSAPSVITYLTVINELANSLQMVCYQILVAIFQKQYKRRVGVCVQFYYEHNVQESRSNHQNSSATIRRKSQLLETWTCRACKILQHRICPRVSERKLRRPGRDRSGHYQEQRMGKSLHGLTKCCKTAPEKDTQRRRRAQELDTGAVKAAG